MKFSKKTRLVSSLVLLASLAVVQQNARAADAGFDCAASRAIFEDSNQLVVDDFSNQNPNYLSIRDRLADFFTEFSKIESQYQAERFVSEFRACFRGAIQERLQSDMELQRHAALDAENETKEVQKFRMKATAGVLKGVTKIAFAPTIIGWRHRDDSMKVVSLMANVVPVVVLYSIATSSAAVAPVIVGVGKGALMATAAAVGWDIGSGINWTIARLTTDAHGSLKKNRELDSKYLATQYLLQLKRFKMAQAESAKVEN